MSKPAQIALLSSDLLFRSRVEAIASRFGVAVTRAWDPGTELVLVDLNSQPDAAIAAFSAHRGEAQVIGFCSHEADQVRIQAMAAGAAKVINNGALERLLIELFSDAKVTP